MHELPAHASDAYPLFQVRWYVARLGNMHSSLFQASSSPGSWDIIIIHGGYMYVGIRDVGVYTAPCAGQFCCFWLVGYTYMYGQGADHWCLTARCLRLVCNATYHQRGNNVSCAMHGYDHEN